MPPDDFLALGRIAADFAGSVVLTAAVTSVLVGLIRGHGVDAARRTIAEGAVLALTIKTAGALLKTLEVQSWEELGAFTAILALRIVLKRTFAWESGRVEAKSAVAPEKSLVQPALDPL